MKNQTLGPNWFLTHTPAPGSHRDYAGAMGWGDARDEYAQPSALHTPATELARADQNERRAAAKLERLAR